MYDNNVVCCASMWPRNLLQQAGMPPSLQDLEPGRLQHAHEPCFKGVSHEACFITVITRQPPARAFNCFNCIKKPSSHMTPKGAPFKQ
jgi:hypothetical protein